MKRIVIEFSRDLRASRIFEDVYGLLRDRGLDPITSHCKYYTKFGRGEAEYMFSNKTDLPNQSELVEILKGRNFDGVEIFVDTEGGFLQEEISPII